LLYKFKTLEKNILKGIIGEHLARSYVRNELAPRLVKTEGWQHVLLSNNDYKRHLKMWNGKLFSFERYREDFILHGFYANMKLLAKYADVIGVLLQSHCTPDGLLLKLRKTGKTRKLKEKDCPKVASLRIDPSQRHGDVLEFPIVDGELEIIEIKCGRQAKLMGKQKETYNNLIAKGIPLRMVKVKIVSFDDNEYLVVDRKFERFV